MIKYCIYMTPHVQRYDINNSIYPKYFCDCLYSLIYCFSLAEKGGLLSFALTWWGFSAPHGNHFLFLIFSRWCHRLLLNRLCVFYNWLWLVYNPVNNASPFCSSPRYGKIVSTKAILDKTTNKCKGVWCFFFVQLHDDTLFYLSSN